MFCKGNLAIVNSAHKNTIRENSGDVLSAKAIAKLSTRKNYQIFFLPKDTGKSKNLETIYGGGGMIRTNFSKREVFKDYLLRNKNIPYCIYGV
jgi:hypothetical protein